MSPCEGWRMPVFVTVFVAAAILFYAQLSAHLGRTQQFHGGRLQTSKDMTKATGLSSARPPRIAVVSMTTGETSYDYYSISNKYGYARKHGYSMHFAFEGPLGAWDKLTVLEELIRENQFDWLWWIDFDAIITNTSIKLENVVNESLDLAQSMGKDPSGIDMILARDCEPLNAGVMIFRATPWLLDFFKQMWRCKSANRYTHKYAFSEQDCIRVLVEANDMGAGDKSVMIKQWKMNAFPEEIGCFDADQRKWEPGMFVLHFAGAWNHVKADDPVGVLMKKYWPNVVHEVASNTQVSGVAQDEKAAHNHELTEAKSRTKFLMFLRRTGISEVPDTIVAKDSASPTEDADVNFVTNKASPTAEHGQHQHKMADNTSIGTCYVFITARSQPKSVTSKNGASNKG